MSKLTDEKKREITERLAEWMGWGYTLDSGGDVWRVGVTGHDIVFWPFASLDAAHLLLVECDRWGLMLAVANVVIEQRDVVGCNGNEGMIQGLLSTPEQITLAVWAVVNEQGKDGT